MNEKQRRARRRAAARAWKKEAKGLSFWQRVTLRALNRAYRKPLKPFIPLVPTLPEGGMARLQVGPEIVYFDEVADVPLEAAELIRRFHEAGNLPVLSPFERSFSSYPPDPS